MRISARNQIKGSVVEVKKGATTSHIRVDIGGGKIVTSSITNEAVDELGIKAKDHVTVVIKAAEMAVKLKRLGVSVASRIPQSGFALPSAQTLDEFLRHG